MFIIFVFIFTSFCQLTSAIGPIHEPGVAKLCLDDFLRLSDEDIYKEGTDGKTIGGFYIERRKTVNDQDDYFVMTHSVGSKGSRGWPRDISGLGTGLVETLSVKDHCIYMNKQFSNVPISERQEMCSLSAAGNAARQLRHALRNNQCDVRSICPHHCESSDCTVPNLTVRTLPWTCKADFIDLDTFTLFQLGVHRLAGGCRIDINTGSNFCDLYVISATVGAHGYRGWPRSFDNRGTGCVKAPDFPKGRNICWYTMWNYKNWPMSDRSKMCASSFGEDNAAEQLRHAILHDQCMLSC